MNKKLLGLYIIVGVATFVIVQYVANLSHSNNSSIEGVGNETFSTINDVPAQIHVTNGTLYITPRATDEGTRTVAIPLNKFLFQHTYYLTKDNHLNSSEIRPLPENAKLYQEIGYYNSTKKIVFVYPIFTQAAYDKNGFYDYYYGRCDSKCLTTNIQYQITGKYTSSIRASAILSILNYPYITDIDIDKNPDILKKYDRVILLHSEYVTQREFDAITHHPDVVYLYPNALYAEIKTDYNSGTMTLVRGHGYPNGTVKNGFGWKFDNTQYEYDDVCNNWQFYNVDNGKMLNCYPSYRLYYDIDLIKSLKTS